MVLGLALCVFGVTLAAGGTWLVALGGSPYYLVTGVLLTVSGALVARRRVAGLWLYVCIYAATLVWAVYEAGTAPWPLVPRAVAPSLVLWVLLAAAPLLRPKPFGVRGALAGIGLCATTFVGAGTLSFWSHAGGPVAAPTGGPGATDAAMMQTGEDWPVYGGSNSARRYSPLAQITPVNVGRMQRVWTAHTRDLPRDAHNYGAETTPIKIGDRLYLCSAKNILLSLDPGTGREIWRFDPQVADKSLPYTAACRGVSYYRSPTGSDETCGSRIIEGTLDARLIAVDAQTGTPCPGFGRDGQVDTTEDMGPAAPGMISITSPPTIVRGLVIVGHQILDGQRRNAPSGVVKAFDAVTGKLAWAWDLGHPERQGRPPEGEIYTQGTPNMWTMSSADETLGLVYLPLGNSAVDYWSSSRSPSEKQFSTSLVALDVMTGRPVWSFQAVHNDVWDYDLGAQATLIDFPTASGPRPALVLPTKMGDIYVLDRRTGQPLVDVTERKAPRGGEEPEQRAATQPASGYITLRGPDLTEASMWGISPIDQMLCRIKFKRARYDGIYTPPYASQPYIQYPGTNGGTDWGGVAVDQQRGVLVANYNDVPNYTTLIPRSQADRLGWAPRGEQGVIGGDPQVGAPFAVTMNAGFRAPITRLPCKEPPYGGIRAIDLATGKTLWDRPLGSARNNGPFGLASRLPLTIGTPNNGGSLVTASGLIFVAAATDDLIRAIDIRTGEVVWSDTLPAGGQATPMTYEADGRQYVVVMAGGHHFMETKIGDELVAYALPTPAASPPP